MLTADDELVPGTIQHDETPHHPPHTWPPDLPPNALAGLTPRETEILRLVAGGKSNGEIAAALVISIRTAERHLANIYAKLGTGGTVARATATSYAHTHGVVGPAAQ